MSKISSKFKTYFGVKPTYLYHFSISVMYNFLDTYLIVVHDLSLSETAAAVKEPRKGSRTRDI